ncbi:DUF2975 domain-containing protein [Dactylosporangium sp. CA-233914]|uniref:DUF2975 domain-containing protein n=1 Tax=Dactylosporangium sp. CA-233914 TaxID=3239934 RepID=UPI003D8B4C17
MRKPDWFQELETALVAGMVLVGAAGPVVALAFGTESPLPVRVPADLVDASAGSAAIDPDGMVDILVEHPGIGQLTLGVLTFLPTLAVVFTLLTVLWRIVRRIRRGGPFDERIVRGVRILGWIAGVGGLVAGFVEAFAEAALSMTVTDGFGFGLPLIPGLLGWVLVGIGCFALAEILRRGMVMRAELDTVI